MANYSLVINSKFRPFEYQELMAPVLQANQAHQQLEEAYGELSNKASVWDKMANEQTDPNAHSMYKAYANDLQKQAEQLAQNGLNHLSRQELINMRNRYAKEIVPIENAYKQREADIKMQKEMMLKDPTHMFDVRADLTSLDKYIDNPKLDVISNNYSKELLTQQVSKAAENLAKDIRYKGKLKSLGLPFQYERVLKNGMSEQEILQALSRDPNTAPILTKLVDDVMESSGIRRWSSMNGDWANNPKYKEAEEAAMRGLFSAIGPTKFEHFTDNYGASLDLERKKAGMKPNIPNLPQVSPLPLRAHDTVTRHNKHIDEMRGWFTPSGNTYVLKGSILAKAKQIKHKIAPDMDGKLIEYDERSPEYKLLNAIPGVPRDKNGNLLLQPGNIGNAFAKYIKDNEKGSYDTYHSTEFDRQLDTSQQESFTQQVWAAAMEEGGLKVAKFKGKKLGWDEKHAEIIKPEDLEGFRVTNVRYSKYGNTAVLGKNGKNSVRVILPRGIKMVAESNVKAAVNNAADYTSILDNGFKPKYITKKDGSKELARDSEGNIVYTNTPLTNADKAYFEKHRDNELLAMTMYGAQLDTPSKTQGEEINLMNNWGNYGIQN